MTGERKLPRVAVIGAGTMGQGIAQLCAQAGCRTLLHDVSEDAVMRAREAIEKALRRRVERGRLDADEAHATLGRIEFAAAISDLAPAELVIEAIVEALEVKRALFAELEAHCAPDALLCTNTSSLSVGAIAEGARHPQRIAGLHFFNPAPAMRLVEVIRAEHTSADACRQLVAWVEALGKRPVVARDRPGFIVNRCARPYYGEALRMLEEGVASAAEIDACLIDGASFPLGPFALMDLVGLDIGLGATRSIWDALGRPARFIPSPLLIERVEAGALGRKSGAGFFDYPRAPEPPLEGPPPACDIETLAARLSQQGGVLCRITDGQTAEAHSRRERCPVMLVDDMPCPASRGRPLRLACAAHEAEPETLERLDTLALEAGYRLVRVADTPGLIVVRMAMMMAGEARRVAQEGVADADSIEQAMGLGLNFAIGPEGMRRRLGEGRLEAVRTALAERHAGGPYHAD